MDSVRKLRGLWVGLPGLVLKGAGLPGIVLGCGLLGDDCNCGVEACLGRKSLTRRRGLTGWGLVLLGIPGLCPAVDREAEAAEACAPGVEATALEPGVL